MTHEEQIKWMADRIAHLETQYESAMGMVETLMGKLKPLTEKAVEAEREACAVIAEKEYQNAKTIEETHYKYSDAPFNPKQFGLNMDLVNQSKYLSFAIRARGQA